MRKIKQAEMSEEVGRLRAGEGRKKTGCVIVEGYPEVRQALRAGVAFEKLFLCPELFEDKKGEFSSMEKTVVSKIEFAQIAFGSRLKGILAICKPKQLNLADLKLGKNPLVVVLEGVEKPGNLGAALRSCDGAGVDALIHCDGKTDIYNQHVVRSSIGTVFCVPTVAAGSQDALTFLKSKGVRIIAATARAEKPYYETDLHAPAAILIGSEHDGLSPFWLKNADDFVTIPMTGKGQCLNAAMSASILVYEALRQREN